MDNILNNEKKIKRGPYKKKQNNIFISNLDKDINDESDDTAMTEAKKNNKKPIDKSINKQLEPDQEDKTKNEPNIDAKQIRRRGRNKWGSYNKYFDGINITVKRGSIIIKFDDD